MVVDDISLTTYPTVPVLAEVFDTSIVPWRSSVLAAEDNPPFQTGIIEWQADSMRLKITQGDFVLGEDTTWLGAGAREIQVQNNTQYRIGLDVLNNLNSLDVPIELNNIVTASINIYDADAFAQTGLLGTEPIAVIPITQYGTIQSGTFRSRQSNIIVLAHMRSGKTQQVAPGVFYIDNLKLELVEKSTTYTCDGSTPNTQIGGKYRFSFNGQEKETEINSGTTSAPFWMYDSRTAHRWNIDPVLYPWHGGYTVFNGNPILYADPTGEFGTKKRAEKYADKNGIDKSNVFNNEGAKKRGNRWGVATGTEAYWNADGNYGLHDLDAVYSTGSRWGDFNNAMEVKNDELYEWADKQKNGGFYAQIELGVWTVRGGAAAESYSPVDNTVGFKFSKFTDYVGNAGFKGKSPKTNLNDIELKLKISIGMYTTEKSAEILKNSETKTTNFNYIEGSVNTPFLPLKASYDSRTKLKAGFELGIDIKKLLQKVGFYPKSPSFEIKGQGVNREEKSFTTPTFNLPGN